MTPERWKRIQEVFALALERAPDARTAFLEEECRSDPDLAKEVESLLTSHEAASSRLLDSPAVEAVSTFTPSAAGGVCPGADPGTAPRPVRDPRSDRPGGMGVVYRARDAKLDRDVAIKVFPSPWPAIRPRSARFEKEAKAVAALSHPNILAIHDFGNDAGIAYAVMELLEGTTLRTRLDGGPIPQNRAVDFALQIAKGLSAAHERGIVHRDLKPENLFVAKDGHLKILDFGLAKRVEPAAPGKETSAPTVSGETQPGTVMGTLGYMSPEQVRGLAVDHRSDVFAFGAILYELLSGERAFRRDTSADTLSATLKEDPPDLSESGRNVSPSLDRIVRHCLEKDRDNRFQSFRDIVFALSDVTLTRAPSGGTPISEPHDPVPSQGPKSRKAFVLAGVAIAVLAAVGAIFLWRSHAGKGPSVRRIVVLPFENLGSPDDGYFAAGVTEEISSRLANLSGLSVISRVTANGYDRKGKTIRQIGSDLGVDYVLEGAVRWDRTPGHEERVRITPELIQVSDDTRVWSDRFDRVTAGVFEVQSEVAENVARAMDLKLLPGEEARLMAASTSDLEAHDLYIRGLEMANRSQTRPDQEGGLRLFESALQRDPRFPQALAMLVRTHLSLYFYFERFKVPPDKAHLEAAKAALDRLVALGGDLAETHVARAYYEYWGFGNVPVGLAEFQVALALQPSNSDAISGISFIYRRQGRWAEAAEAGARWLEIDPRDPHALFQYGHMCSLVRRYGEADRAYRLSTTFGPRNSIPWAYRAWLQILWHGDVAGARVILDEAREVAGLDDEQGLVAYRSYTVALAERNFKKALEGLDAERRSVLVTQMQYNPIDLLRAEALALSGQHDEARQYFEAARKDLEAPLANNPEDFRYQSALGVACAGLGLREEALKAGERGVELMPASKDAWRARWPMESLARIHVMLGQQEEAIDQLGLLLAQTGEVSGNVLRVDPRWDPLRSNARFQALLGKRAEKP